MPYVDLEQQAARRSRRVESLQERWPEKSAPPEGGRLIGRAFQAPEEEWLVAPDPGTLAMGKPIPRDRLRSLIEKAFAGRFSSGSALRPEEKMDDWAYYAPTLREIDKVVATRSAKGKAYETDIFDCEDFAYSLRADFARNRYDANAKDTAFAAGIVWGEITPGKPHVANIVAVHAPPGGAEEFAVRIVDTIPENFSAVVLRSWLIDPARWAVVDYIVI